MSEDLYVWARRLHDKLGIPIMILFQHSTVFIGVPEEGEYTIVFNKEIEEVKEEELTECKLIEIYVPTLQILCLG